MSSTTTHSIALILQTRMEDNVAILRGIAAFERAHADWNFFLDDQAMSVRDPEWLFRKNWDGVICRHPNTAVLEACVRRGVPCIDLDDSPRIVAHAPKVRPDNRAIGHLGAEHFLDRGFRRVGFCGWDTESWSCERRDGFAEALAAVGIRCDIFETPYCTVVTPEWDLSEQRRIEQWLDTLPEPTAVMACNDMRALQVINAAHELGRSVPESVAVLGANNESIRVEISHPPLSSVPLNAHEWGRCAASLLHRLLMGESIPEISYISPLTVEVRRSTDALAIEDAAIVEARRIIHAEACGSLRVEDIARRVHISRSLLERRFRKLLRRTPQEEIRSAKIHRTKQLLIDSDKTLAEIAELTGFEHTEYLSVMFKRLTGETPRDFRQRHRSENRD